MIETVTTKVRGVSLLLAGAYAAALGGGLGLALGCVIHAQPHCEDVECGDNAYCDRGSCACVWGYWSEDPAKGCDPQLRLRLTDECDDGANVSWRLFSKDREWSWPPDAEETAFSTLDYAVDSFQTIVCDPEETLCFGGEGKRDVWGVGVRNEVPEKDVDEDAWCFPCEHKEVDVGRLTCD